MVNFIDEYKQFILNNIPADPNWAEDIATILLSTAIGDKFICTSHGELQLNIWIFAIGRSRIGYKTQPMKMFAIPVINDLELSFPGEFTKEALTEHISGSNEAIGKTSGLIVRDEVGTIFKEPRYNSSLLEFLSMMYSGNIPSRRTRKAGLELGGKCCVSFLGATTPYMYKLLKDEHFTQGFANRILWDVLDPLVEEITESELFHSRHGNDKLNQTREDFTHWLRSVRDATPAEYHSILTLNDNTRQLLTDFKNEMTRTSASLSDTDFMGTYYGSCAENAIKLTCIRGIGKYYQLMHSKSDFEQEITIIKKDAEWAIAKVRRHTKMFIKIIKNWTIKIEENPIESDKELLSVLCAKIEDHIDEDGWFNAQTVSNAYGWNLTRNLRPHLETLRDQGKIKIYNKKQMIDEEFNKLPIHGRTYAYKYIK